MNRFCELLGLKIPIVQAPTASIAGPELAAAVSTAGALGAMGFTWTPPETAITHVRQVRGATDRPFLVNFALAFEPASLPAVLDAGAPIVSFSWGNPEPYLPRVRAAGAKFGMQVGSAGGARRALALGVDFIVCQGNEAGGHVQSTTALDTLLPAILAEVGDSVPVIAAGGIADGARVARYLNLGAQAAVLGTRFVATQESRAHPEYKRCLLEAQEDATALTVCFDGGWSHAPHRVLRNVTLEGWEAAGCPPPGRRPGEGLTVAYTVTGEPILRYEDAAPRGGMTGDVSAMALYAGTGVSAISDLPPAGELVRRLWADAVLLLND